MKKIACIATTFILCGIQLFAQDSTYYWKNGKIQCKGAWLDGTEQGLWTYWDSLGNKIQESTFLRGRLNGKNCIYKNGIKIQESTYVLNELSGPYTEWNEEGTKMVEGYYKRNRKEAVKMERVDIYALTLLITVIIIAAILGMIVAYIAGKSVGFSEGVKYYKTAERAIRSGRVKVHVID